jgi:hypothetical protein
MRSHSSESMALRDNIKMCELAESRLISAGNPNRDAGQCPLLQAS